MSDTERQQAFLDGIKALEAQYGFALRSSIFVAGFGSVVETADNNPIRPGPVVLSPIAGWVAPEETSRNPDVPV